MVFPCCYPAETPKLPVRGLSLKFPHQISKHKLKSAQTDGANTAWPEKPPTDNPAWQKWLTVLAGLFPFLLGWRATLTADWVCAGNRLGPPASCPSDGGWWLQSFCSSWLTASKLPNGHRISSLHVCYSETQWGDLLCPARCTVIWKEAWSLFPVLFHPFLPPNNWPGS